MGVMITARRDGFRRGGIAHSAAGTFYPDGTLTEDQLKAFRGEPHLVVVEGVEDPGEQGNAVQKPVGDSAVQSGAAPSAAPVPPKTSATPAPAVGARARGGRQAAKPKPDAPAAVIEQSGAQGQGYQDGGQPQESDQSSGAGDEEE